MKTNFATRKRDAARVGASQRDAGKCHCRLPKTGLSQHSLVELGHSLRLFTRFENQALKKFHWNLPRWPCSTDAIQIAWSSHEIRG